MDSTLESFVERMSQIELRPPQIPYVSNLTGRWITAAEATDPRYWAKHLRNTVQFAEGVGELLCQPGRVMIEVGPGQTLASLVRRQIGKGFGGNTAKVFSTLPGREHAGADTAYFLETVGQLWIGGQSVDWHALHRDEAVSRIPLPTYPFKRQRFWIDPDRPAPLGTTEPGAHRRRSHTPWLMKPRRLQIARVRIASTDGFIAASGSVPQRANQPHTRRPAGSSFSNQMI